MPDYRLSKFQEALPRQRSLEVVREYLLDVNGTLRYLEEALIPKPHSANGTT